MTYLELDKRDQKMIALMGAVAFGRLENFIVENGFAKATADSLQIITDNYEHDDAPRIPKRDDGNFILTEKHVRFLRRIRRVKNGKIKSITIRFGLPVSSEIAEAVESI